MNSWIQLSIKVGQLQTLQYSQNAEKNAIMAEKKQLENKYKNTDAELQSIKIQKQVSSL